MTLKDTISINARPEKIYGWFMHFVENYRSWHPGHIRARWLKGGRFEEGSILYAEEHLGDKLEKLKFKITKNIPDRLLQYRVLFPESLICSGGSFEIEEKNNQSLLSVTLSFRLGKILPALFKKRAALFAQHMKEEGENIKKLMEK